ncbi:transposase [Streptomyces mirabilis]|uniref:transposase n=1 Tax=Streptomyces mirabilis TaxID=68239 RepID=UPI0036C185AF
MDAVLKVAPFQGETTWSFLHRVAAAYGLQATDLTGGWRWVNSGHRSRGVRPDSEVLLDAVAQEQLAGWCRVPAGQLVRALPSWSAGPAALDGRGGQGQGWARWRVGSVQWGPVVSGCRLCTGRRDPGAERVWVYRARWQRLCVRHGRWLLDVGEGHPLEFADVGCLTRELSRAQRRFGRLVRARAGAGVEDGEMFALARAVVCGWWERKDFWARERVWGPRLERVVTATRGQYPGLEGWEERQWRLLVRDAVIFPEVVTVAAAVSDPVLWRVAAGSVTSSLVRKPGGSQEFVAALGARLGREWLGEVERSHQAGPLSVWVQAVARDQRRPAGVLPPPGRGMWWVRSAHRPVEVGPGLRLLAPASDTGAGPGGAAVPAAGAGPGGRRAEPAVPRRTGHGQGLARRHEELFAEGLEHARAHAARWGHLALPHTSGRAGAGFDLGRWLANRRADAASLTRRQAEQLGALDTWWDPPWPVDWQRAWYHARTHVRERGPVHGGDNLQGLPRWLERWLRHQITHYPQLHDGQQQLLAELGLTAGEAERFHAWPGRRRPASDGLSQARAYAARHGHLAVSKPTRTDDGFALGTWLSQVRQRQHPHGRPTRLGRHLTAIDPWWDPPWPVTWQRRWWACRHHLAGLPDGLALWPGAPDAEQATAWLDQQAARRPLLQPGQQDLIDELTALTSREPGWRPRISDHAWQILSTLLPPLPHHGGRRRSERQILEAIIHIACTGQPWTQLPHTLGPFQACLRRYQAWHADGTLTRISHTLLPEPDTAWQQRLAAHIALAAGRS